MGSEMCIRDRYKVRQLAITTVFLSSIFIFRFGPHTVRQLAITMHTLSKITATLFQLGTIMVRQLAISTAILSRFLFFGSVRSQSGNWP